MSNEAQAVAPGIILRRVFEDPVSAEWRGGLPTELPELLADKVQTLGSASDAT